MEKAEHIINYLKEDQNFPSKFSSDFINQHNYIKFKTLDNIINDNALAHYEIFQIENSTKLEIWLHFEDESRMEFKKQMGDDYLKATMLSWELWWEDKKGKNKKYPIPNDGITNCYSIKYNPEFELDILNPNVANEISKAFIYMEDTIGEKIREVINNIKSKKYIELEKNNMLLKNPLNQILYGAPGTGKTYNTINHALAIIENKPIAEYDNMNRADLKKIFDDYIDNGQIAFVTFHQSLSYEDFIEGLKPKSEGNNISYAVEDGIFKQIAKKAAQNIAESKSDITDNFEVCYRNFILDLQETENYLLNTPQQKKTFNIYINSKGSFIAKPKTAIATEMAITKDMIYEYLMYEQIPNYWKPYIVAISNHLKEKYHFEKTKKSTYTPINNYVLIIDEINRGNVAQIFGELITLIEQSKRQEATEAINLTLPYSKETFGVPQNLYIIGTMNTADRSVEALDTALRRRFDFVEMQPKPEILAGKMSEICLKTVLTNLNARIAYLLDSDHAIGHAYFMDVDNADKLAQVFEHKIVPLLREYFYNDYEKIQMILGEDFVKNKDGKIKFAGGKKAKERRIYEFQQVQVDKIIAALKMAGLDE